MPSLIRVVAAYQAQFGNAPMLAGLPAEKELRAMTALTRAMARDEPFESDVDFYMVIDWIPPPLNGV